MKCPKCGSRDVNAQVVNETDTYIVRKHHGILWWIFIGWWWLPLKWALQFIVFNIFAVIYWLLKTPKYKQVTRHQKVSMWVCQDCGYTWEAHRRR